jgi:hypothetical protein
MNIQPFSRPAAIGLLLLLGVVFASNHIAARFAFDHGTGLVTAVLVRSGVTALILLAVVMWLKAPLKLAAYQVPKRWVCWLGALIALQSVLLYCAVARIPVALALLVFNLFPALFTLLNWLLGGPRPSARTAGQAGRRQRHILGGRGLWFFCSKRVCHCAQGDGVQTQSFDGPGTQLLDNGAGNADAGHTEPTGAWRSGG